MKKILYSLLIAGGVGGLAFGATQAWFSDRETSVGNTFVAGRLDLQIDSTAHYDGMVCQGGHWTDEDSSGANNPRPDLLTMPCTGTFALTDLTTEKFFNFTDVKPGDYGENTISMHITDNPAWACIDINNMHNDDNGLTEPEASAGDITGSAGQGELAQNLRFTAWKDGNCDNVWGGDQTEPLLFTNEQGPASDVLNGKTYTLADSVLQPTPFPGGVTSCIGLAWCAGTMTINHGPHTIVCDGASMGNDTQSDSLTADITFRVEQYRNNPHFSCVPSVTPTPTPIPQVTP